MQDHIVPFFFPVSYFFVLLYYIITDEIQNPLLPVFNGQS